MDFFCILCLRIFYIGPNFFSEKTLIIKLNNSFRLNIIHCGLELNQDKSKCRALGPMYGENRHKTMMIPGKTKIFQRGLFVLFQF